MTLPAFSSLFLLFCVVMATAVFALLVRYSSGRGRLVAVVLFASWLLYAGGMGYAGVIARPRPPGPVLLIVPFAVFLVAYLTRRPEVSAFASKVPVAILVGLHTFRIFVEVGFFELFRLGLVPRLMTFERGNLDILVGLSAPLVAWLHATRRIGIRAVRAWSWFGIALLANAVARAILTAPGFPAGRFSGVPDRAIGLFPFTFIPGFLAPLALCLHVLLLRSGRPTREVGDAGRLDT